MTQIHVSDNARGGLMACIKISNESEFAELTRHFK